MIVYRTVSLGRAVASERENMHDKHPAMAWQQTSMARSDIRRWRKSITQYMPLVLLGVDGFRNLEMLGIGRHAKVLVDSW